MKKRENPCGGGAGATVGQPIEDAFDESAVSAMG